MKKYLFFILLSSILLIVACSKDSIDGGMSGPKFLDQDYLSDNVPSFTGMRKHTMTNEQITLGRVLFYDDALSFNGKTSCGSCHLQNKGFADGKALSDGFLNQKTELHSMTLVNTNAGNRFFWDGRATNLNKQVLMPIANHIEMGVEDQALLVEKVRGQEYYGALFTSAYGSDEVTPEGIGNALSSFVTSLVSYDTKYDRVKNETATFTASEERGKLLFESKYNCSSCHGGENFNSAWGGTDLANIGLDEKEPENWSGLAKVPSLRNVAVTAPYMHDGRKATLEEVLTHYSRGIKNNPLLDWRLRNQTDGGPIKLNISSGEMTDMIAFLNTLTDQSLLTDIKYSNPF